jgi:CRISPR-associated endonuclease/helicase Cas3
MATDITRVMVGGGGLNPDDPATAREFYEKVLASLGVNGTDRERIQDARRGLDFPAVAERFRLIEGAAESVAITSYGLPAERARVRRILGRLQSGAPHARGLFRELQPYLVSLYGYQAEEYRRRGLIGDVTEGLGEWLGGYDEIRGLTAERMQLDELVV